MLARIVLVAMILQGTVSAAVLTHSWREGTLDLKLDDGMARVEWVSPVAFRVFRRWGAGPIDSSEIKHDPVLVALDDVAREDAGAAFRMTTRYLTVEVSRTDQSRSRCRSGQYTG